MAYYSIGSTLLELVNYMKAWNPSTEHQLNLDVWTVYVAGSSSAKRAWKIQTHVNLEAFSGGLEREL